MTPLDASTPAGETARGRQLREVLEAQRDDILGMRRQLIDETKHAPTTGGAVLDEAELSEADIQEELDFALLEMYSETLAKIEDALSRLASGHYGNCVDCGGPIAARRLAALPFAARCRTCEERQETAAADRRPHASWRLLDGIEWGPSPESSDETQRLDWARAHILA